MAESLERYKPSSEDINLDKIIGDLGSMTDGNVNMINSYINPGSVKIKKVRQRKRRR